jgi:hypothetical protein
VEIVTFEGLPRDVTPPGFLTARTGGGEEGTWVVLEDKGPPSGLRVLAQIGADATGNRYPLCVRKSPAARDVEAGVRFKAVSGKVDQAGGVVVRYQDRDNYYVARANALENNVRFYKVQGGKRTQLAGLDAPVSGGAWHELKLKAVGARFVITFDGRSFQADDATFGGAGLVGVWTKADSVTYFDDLRIEVLDQP